MLNEDISTGIQELEQQIEDLRKEFEDKFRVIQTEIQSFKKKLPNIRVSEQGIHSRKELKYKLSEKRIHDLKGK